MSTLGPAKGRHHVKQRLLSGESMRHVEEWEQLTPGQIIRKTEYVYLKSREGTGLGCSQALSWGTSSCLTP